MYRRTGTEGSRFFTNTGLNRDMLIKVYTGLYTDGCLHRHREGERQRGREKEGGREGEIGTVTVQGHTERERNILRLKTLNCSICYITDTTVSI